MKRDFNIVVRNFDGSVIENPVYETESNGVHRIKDGQMQLRCIEPVKLKKFLFDLLGGRLKGDDNITGADLMARYAVANKIAVAGDGLTEIDDEDVKALTAVLDKGASPLIYGMTKALLNKDPEPVKVAESAA